MITNICIDKQDYPPPGFVHDTLVSLRRWRKNRDRKDLPCGDLDRAIAHLEQFHELLGRIYVRELNQHEEGDQE